MTKSSELEKKHVMDAIQLMHEDYIKIPAKKGYAYVRIRSLDRLREADAAIFDCDGVLIDTRDSYRKSIVETIKFFLRELTAVELPLDRTILEATHLLKRSGGFNNDWDVAYAIILFLFSKLPQTFQYEFITLTSSDTFLQIETFQNRFDFIKTSLKSKIIQFSMGLEELTNELKKFTQRVDDTGVSSVEREFADPDLKAMFLAVKRFLNYPSNGKESLLAIVFDEMFYGPELFEQIYGRKRQFYDEAGFVEIEKERILVTVEILEELAQAIGRENFGIVSGRDQLSAKFSLGKILNKFKSDAVIFLMDYNYPNGQFEDDQIKLRKPYPYPLIKAAKGLDPFKYSLVVGDSAEDIIMVRRANEIENKFISVGVYTLSNFKDELISYFFNGEADLILHSIVELPSVIRAIKVKGL